MIVHYKMYIIKNLYLQYTEKQAKSLNLNGWCMNTRDDTVKGQLEGPLREINEM
jgi:acylphosphatase